MEFSITGHAGRQMLIRGVSPEMVSAVLDNPTWQLSSTANTVYAAMVDGRRLTVVIAEDRAPVVLVTVWWDDEPEE